MTGATPRTRYNIFLVSLGSNSNCRTLIAHRALLKQVVEPRALCPTPPIHRNCVCGEAHDEHRANKSVRRAIEPRRVGRKHDVRPISPIIRDRLPNDHRTKWLSGQVPSYAGANLANHSGPAPSDLDDNLANVSATWGMITKLTCPPRSPIPRGPVVCRSGATQRFEPLSTMPRLACAAPQQAVAASTSGARASLLRNGRSGFRFGRRWLHWGFPQLSLAEVVPPHTQEPQGRVCHNCRHRWHQISSRSRAKPLGGPHRDVVFRIPDIELCKCGQFSPISEGAALTCPTCRFSLRCGRYLARPAQPDMEKTRVEVPVALGGRRDLACRLPHGTRQVQIRPKRQASSRVGRIWAKLSQCCSS